MARIKVFRHRTLSDTYALGRNVLCAEVKIFAPRILSRNPRTFERGSGENFPLSCVVRRPQFSEHPYYGCKFDGCRAYNMKSDRESYLKSRRRDLTQYAGMIGEEFRSKVDQLSKILGSAHEASVGEYKESLLRSCLQQFLPKRYSVGTGFVVFSAESVPARIAEDNTDLLNLKD